MNATIAAIYAISKLPKCREFLTSEAIQMDHHLYTLLQSISSNEAMQMSSHAQNKLKYNVSRVLKNVTANSAEAIEEGAVASLIALSLEGRPKSRIGHDVTIPEIIPFHSSLDKTILTAHYFQDVENHSGKAHTEFYWHEPYKRDGGGPAKKGIEPPEPPTMKLDDINLLYPSMNEDIENLEVENKTKMSFAKMQIPIELRSSYLLTDEDFMPKRTPKQNHNQQGELDSIGDDDDFDDDDEEEQNNNNNNPQPDGDIKVKEKLRIGGELDNEYEDSSQIQVSNTQTSGNDDSNNYSSQKKKKYQDNDSVSSNEGKMDKLPSIDPSKSRKTKITSDKNDRKRGGRATEKPVQMAGLYM